MRILQIAKHFAPDVGGIETVTRDLSEGFARRDVQADVLCVEFEPPYEPVAGDYAVIRTPSDFGFGNKRISRDYVRKIAQLSSEYDVAVVHMPNPLAAAGVLAGWDKPYVLLWHADIPQRIIRQACAPFDRKLIAAASAIIGPTPIHLSGSRHAASFAKHPKTVVIPLPFDDSRLPPPDDGNELIRSLAEWKTGSTLVLSIGRLVGYKGYDILIQAAQKLPDHFRFVIAGDGPERAKLREQIDAAKLSDKVKLVGRIPDQELSNLLEMSDIVCMPSISEAEMYGVAQVEGMARAKPIVSTRLERSGVPYVNRHNETGLLATPGDPDELAEALRRLAEDTELYERLSAGAKRAFQSEHTLDAVIDAYLSLLGEIIHERSPAPPG